MTHELIHVERWTWSGAGTELFEQTALLELYHRADPASVVAVLIDGPHNRGCRIRVRGVELAEFVLTRVLASLLPDSSAPVRFLIADVTRHHSGQAAPVYTWLSFGAPDFLDQPRYHPASISAVQAEIGDSETRRVVTPTPPLRTGPAGAPCAPAGPPLPTFWRPR